MMEIKMPEMNIPELMSKVGNVLREVDVPPDLRMTITQMSSIAGIGGPWVMVHLKFEQVDEEN